MATSKKGPNLHGVPAASGGKKFVVKEAGTPTPLTRPASQQKSIEKAIPVAKQNHSEVVIHRMNGKIRDSDKYGNDPNPPKDTKN